MLNAQSLDLETMELGQVAGLRRHKPVILRQTDTVRLEDVAEVLTIRCISSFCPNPHWLTPR